MAGNMTSSTIRVLLVIDRLSERAGAEGSTALLVRELQGQGFRFAAFTVGGGVDPDLGSELESAGVLLREGPTRWMSAGLALRRLAKESEPDLVHAVLFRSELVARTALFGGPPILGSIVSTQYSPEAIRVTPSARKLEVVRRIDGALARRATTHFHAVSQSAADEAVRSLGIRRDKVTVIRRGRDRRTLGFPGAERRARARAVLGIGDQSPIVFTAARHEPAKRLDILVTAFARLRASTPDALLLVAGRDGGTSEQLRVQIRSLGLSSSVRLLGQRSDVADLLCAADVFAFSSTYEGLPGAVIESLALDLPVVAFDIPPVREVVSDAGVLVPVGDAEALAEAMAEVLRDRELAATLVRRGSERFEKLFTIDRYVDEFADLYRSVAAGSR